MNRLLCFISLLFFLLVSKVVVAQDGSNNEGLEEIRKPTVEGSLWGVQVGTLGIWGHHEFGFAERFVLRSEVGLNMGFGGSGGEIVKFVLYPTILFEPRWYYFLDEDAKVFSKNSGSFLAVKAQLNLPWTVNEIFAEYSYYPRGYAPGSLIFLAKWGLRKTLWEHFTYEIGIGFGYELTFWRNREARHGYALDIHLRMGYTF